MESNDIVRVYQSMEVIIIESLLALIAVGTVGFWLFWAFALVGMVWLTEFEYTISTVFATVAIALVLWLGYDFNIFLYALTHKVNAVIAAIAYFGIGAAWMLAKWGFYVQSLMDRALENFPYGSESLKVWTNVKDDIFARKFGKVQFADSIGAGDGRFSATSDLVDVKPGDPVYKDAKYAWIVKFYHGTGTVFPPALSGHKARAIYWVASWPFSFLWFLLNKPIKYISTFIVNRLSGIAGRITNWVIAINLR